MSSNSNKNVVDIIEFEELIENGTDNIDENLYYISHSFAIVL